MIRSGLADCVDTEVDQFLKQNAFGHCWTVDLMISGVKTSCLWDTGFEVTTIKESHFREHFGEEQLKSTHWVEPMD